MAPVFMVLMLNYMLQKRLSEDCKEENPKKRKRNKKTETKESGQEEEEHKARKSKQNISKAQSLANQAYKNVSNNTQILCG